ncbi:hypothetical protein VOLCADRAFT_98733 [Volvox carteri f. nagariensis]|uniref:Uncharacterized protein n=1 Tax=Volvox carteri f. nagariensis TaxID=3068 RepID=D8UG54_VOLCA|nr:uncharacterized protein VOLCADRAFT_98733 [Volvox carteri f. nagariensis]EFJ41293.1 hypothetical protein VOLCADRAFT_98733 [Volvox carteri f. nagariensis]|eukprot:XP_002957627.1 hypothetical protein VOLCADRAFT_98733 [Volvox carteri f. nagariensis]
MILSPALRAALRQAKSRSRCSQSVSQFDSQSQLQLLQQQEWTRGSFLLQPNTLVSSSVASSAATSAVVVTIGTNVPSAGVNSGLQSQQPPPPPPSRASLAAALAHTGDGSLSTASWLQPPPPVKPPPPSRNSVPQLQRPEQQQMLTQQLSESYGSESTVSTLQNMYGGSTGLRPQLQAGTWAAKWLAAAAAAAAAIGPGAGRLKLHPGGLSKALHTQQTVAAGTGIEGGAETLEVNSGAPVGRMADRRMGRAAAAAAAGVEAALPRPKFTFGEPRSLCSRRRSSMAVVQAGYGDLTPGLRLTNGEDLPQNLMGLSMHIR